MRPDNSPVRLDDWAERTAKPFDEMTWEERFHWCLDALCKMESRAESAENKLAARSPLPEPVPFAPSRPTPTPRRPAILLRDNAGRDHRVQKARLAVTYAPPAKLMRIGRQPHPVF